MNGSPGIKQATAPRPSGLITVTDVNGRTMEADTVHCVHCGRHWVWSPGSKNIRGWCGNCQGFVCGPGCAECVPVERKIEMIERDSIPR